MNSTEDGAEADPARSRFGTRGDKSIKEELTDLSITEEKIDKTDSHNTKKMTRSSIKIFADFLMEYKDTQVTGNNSSHTTQELFPYRQVGLNLQHGDTIDWDLTDLNRMLKLFFANTRKSNGDYYKKNSFISHKHSLARFFKQIYSLNITDDAKFTEANGTYLAALVELRNKGKASVSHFQYISDDDLIKLYTSWDLSSPQGLQEKVLFDIIFFLGCKSQVLPYVSKDTFKIYTDDKMHNRKYVSYVNDEQNSWQEDDASKGRMYEVPGMSALHIS